MGKKKATKNQPPLEGMEDADSRIPALEEQCQRILANRDKRRSLKEDIDEDLGTVGELLHKNELDLYIVAGNKFFVEPGRESVKIKKVNQKG